MKPQISVIMPVFNQEKYLAETIESVLTQSFRNFEFIILDDGSTDNSAQIIKKYAAIDDRIIASYETNSGKSASTNKLVSRATTEWLAFLDADDVMLPERLEKQFAYHKAHPEVDATSCHCFYINHKSIMYGKQRYPGLKKPEDCKQALANNETIMCSFTGMMTSKNAYLTTGGLRTEMTPCEDLDFFNRLVEKGFSLVIIQEELMKYRLHPTAATSSNPMRMYNMMNYTTNCIYRRRAGKPERTFEEYMAIKQQDSWWTRLNRKRFTYSQLYFRNAGTSYISREYLRFVYLLFLASLLSPNHILYKVNNLIAKRI
ncbi:glycosyltransferase family 2 protein [Pontibacter sp. H249]|uniref:glycosyltransferase family 2 protein n=1 Tax=Pontibacter sp. H249 TaxID=3133420 RepID=UPI0030C01913